MYRESRHPKTLYKKSKDKKLGCGGIPADGSEVDLEAVHEFYKAVQESPLLYPYFMNVKADKREDVIQNIACSFHKTLQKEFSPEDSLRLRNIHKKLNITDNAYNRFTKLFAHMCCKNKNDKLRARMLKAFSELKSEICSASVKHPIDLTSFFELLTDSSASTTHPKNQSESNGETLPNKFVNEQKNKPCDLTRCLVLERAKAWNNRNTHEELVKKISYLETKASQLVSLNNEIYARLEEKYKKLNH